MVLSFCLIFCQFQPGVAYKRVVCKLKRVNRSNSKVYSRRKKENGKFFQKKGKARQKIGKNALSILKRAL